MATDYVIPAGTHRAEQVIDRSRFIATIAPAATPDAARAFIDAVRGEFADATHNCWAYVTGPPGSTAFIGMSDAGEPHGTAGRPMLDVLLHSGIGDVVAVVTRYYGGVKLGKGGLVRAYGGSVQNALQALPTVMRVSTTQVEVSVAYGDVDVLRRLAADTSAVVLAEYYGEAASYRLLVPDARMDEFARTLADRTAGRAVLRRGGDEQGQETRT
jgi:uncharacterized YigZ family protein